MHDISTDRKVNHDVNSITAKYTLLTDVLTFLTTLPEIGTHTLLRILELHESCHVTFYNSVKFVAFIAFALIENVVTSIDNNSQGALCNSCKSIRIILYIIHEADCLFSTHHGKRQSYKQPQPHHFCTFLARMCAIWF